MQYVNGIYLPDGDKHFTLQVGNSPIVEGKGTYQLGKLNAALDNVPVSRRRLAIDIGAQVGLWTRILAREFDRVIAVEPTQEYVSCLIKNIEPYNQKVSIYQFPLGDGFKRVDLKRDVENSTARICVEGEDGDFWLMASTLDQFVLEDVDFIKVDCEGFEYFVLKGGEKTIKREKPVVVVEQKKKRIDRYGLDRKQPAVKLLQEWGMKEFWAKAGDHCLGWGD